MVRRLAALTAFALAAPFLLVGGPAQPATPDPGEPARAGGGGRVLVVEGKGSAHGMGLAMDGVLGQAQAGWSYRRILSLFYTDAPRFERAGGTIRVGILDGPHQVFALPGGGTVTDRVGGGGPGFPVTVGPGGRVVVTYADGRHRVSIDGPVQAAQVDLLPSPTPTPPPEDEEQPEPEPQPTAPPGEAPPQQPPAPEQGDGLSSPNSIWIVPSGNPALVRSENMGRRYRGRMEARFAPSTNSIWAINHVDLETYVMGIAEEKGQGWPVEALKVLAVAARTLGVATMQWYDRHHEKGFDICPTGACQVYFGYDGEEPAMTQATRETAGEILTYAGRPILAMYHGNGGGVTETYQTIFGSGAYPYLRGVAYPHGRPSSWSRSFTPAEARAALAAAGRPVHGELRGVEILQRGDSPRVRRLRVVGSAGTTEMTGQQLMHALDLRSYWFDVRWSDEVPPPSEEEVETDGETRAGAFFAPPPRPEPRPALATQAAETPRRGQLLALAAFIVALAVRTAVPARSRRSTAT